MGDSVFTSEALESALADKDLKSAYEVPQSAVVASISATTTGMSLPEQKVRKVVATDVGLNAGLGIKRKKEMMEGVPQVKRIKKKPKTLSEKREMLEKDILKYGMTAIEKLYPRQQPEKVSPSGTPHKRKRGPRIKMKTRPPHDFEEVDAQAILRPYSHGKYIQEPDVRSVVYVRRRRAMIPLSSLSRKSSTSTLSSDAKLLAGRNVSYGRPCLFVKEAGRVIAIGGSRNKENDFLRIIPIPDIKSIARGQRSSDFVPFYMDDEFASIAVGAVKTPKRKPKIDIRALKRIQRKQSTDLKKVLKDKSIVDHVFDKMNLTCDPKEENPPPAEEEERLVLSDDPDEEEECTDSRKIFNRLLDSTSSFTNPLPDPEGCPVTSSEFQAALKERNTKEHSGYESCDIEDCFCRHSYALMDISTPATDGTQTPESNVHTPVESKGQHVVRNLKKVKRALKTLGVNLVEFESQNGIRKDCDRDYCRLGCVCETLLGNPVLPNHCSKVECMFRCHCSEETLKKLSSSRKVAISPSAFSNFTDKSPNNVVTTGGRDLIMISGRQKRERKMPTRYQDTDALESGSSEFMSKCEDVFGLDTILVPGRGDPNIVKMISEGLKEGLSRKCTVLVPKINLSPEMEVKPWCMFHCRHSCPCFKYENPLDFGPDLSKSRNMARRSSRFSNTLICLDDDDEETEKSSSGGDKAYSLRRDQCARTQGISISPSYKLKMPHKFLTKKESADVESGGDIIKLTLPNDEKKTVIDLSLKPRKSVQYLHWYVLHYIFKMNIVRIWYTTRNGKFVFFISAFNTPSAIHNSSCVKELIRHTSDAATLPIFARELSKEAVRNTQKFAILTSSGFSWEITGILQKKADKVSQQQQPKEQQPVMNLELSSQRLSPGQNLVTVVQSDKALMQIKLPETGPEQYWYTLGVPSGPDSVPCPERPINIKASTIVHAAGVANSQNTTVRVPIDASSSSGDSFGIYAVPCLDNHVFVGPFAIKEEKSSSPEVICLDDEDTHPCSSTTQQLPVKAQSSGCRRKQKLTTKIDDIDRMNNQKLVSTLVQSVADKAVTFGERRRKRSLSSRQVIMGSVPQVVHEEATSGSKVFVEGGGELRPMLQSEVLKECLKKGEELPCYQNLPQSQYGKIVRGEISDKGTRVVLLSTNNQEVFQAHQSISREGQVMFYHPSFPNHFVMCGNVEAAKKWMEEYKVGLPSIAASISLREAAERARSRPSMSEEERQEYIQLFFKLRKSILPEHESSLTYNRIQVIDRARETVDELRKKISLQEVVKKKLLNERSCLFDTFTSNLKGLPVDVKKKFVHDLKTGLKKKKKSPRGGESPPPQSSNKATPKKGSSSMPALIPIPSEENKQPALPSQVPTPPPTNEKKRRKPLNAFMLWAKKQRPALVSSGLTTVELSRMLVDKWHMLSQAERLQYQIEADRLKNSSTESSLVKEEPPTEEQQGDEKKKPPLKSSKASNPPIIEISLD